MLQLLRVSALVSITCVAVGAVGKASVSVSDRATPHPELSACAADTPIQSAVGALDYAEAVLIANGEMYFGQTVEEIHADIAALPRYEDQDGISDQEAAALEDLLRFGRQLAYARATEELKRQIGEQPDTIRVASADGGITVEMLENLRGGC